MSSLAAILLDTGEIVSGCDRLSNQATEILRQRGAQVYSTHSLDHLSGVTRVIFTNASSRVPEVDEARARGLGVRNRSELLGDLMDERRGIAVAGTHGKTSTTSVLAEILIASGMDPLVAVGGVPAGWSVGGRFGAGEWMVAEADEFDFSFLHLHPNIAIVTGIEADHPDFYPDLRSLQNAFVRFLTGVREGGLLLVWAGSESALEAARSVAANRNLRVETYGGREDANWRPVIVTRCGARTEFEIHSREGVLDNLSTSLPGRYNLDNVTAAAAAAIHAGADVETVRGVLTWFRGVARRFEVKGTVTGVTVVDDYAHHPTAIETIVRAARESYPGLKVWIAFQPHTYSRTRQLWTEFAQALRAPDKTYLLDIYAAREQPIAGVSSERLAQEAGGHVHYTGGLDETANLLASDLTPGILLITMGAGDVTYLGDRLLKSLESREG